MKSMCGTCNKEFKHGSFFSPPGISKLSGIIYKNRTAMFQAERKGDYSLEYYDSNWLVICRDCYNKKATLPEGMRVEKPETEDNKPESNDGYKPPVQKKTNDGCRKGCLVTFGIFILLCMIVGMCSEPKRRTRTPQENLEIILEHEQKGEVWKKDESGRLRRIK
jgi:hypothetical protein